MKIEIFSLALPAFLSCWVAQAADIAAESKRANEFFDKCWDETVARHPVDESFYGIKTHYDQLEDLSDEKAAADLKALQDQLATLHREFKLESLDASTQLSYKLFDLEVERAAEEFRFRIQRRLVRLLQVHAGRSAVLFAGHRRRPREIFGQGGSDCG
jgi:uncharacterized protein (DUF885 family)